MSVREQVTERDGVRIERRELVGFSLAGLAGLAATGLAGTGRADAGTGRQAAAATPFDRVGFTTFVEHWQELAAELEGADPAADAAYLGRLVALASRLRLDELPGYLKRNEGPDSVGGPIWSGSGLFMVRFDLQPGATIRPHDHYPMSVLTVGVKGQCHYRHFESVDAPGHESRETFHLTETRSGWLARGRATGLSRERDFVHTFRAGPQGASIVDLGCPQSDSNDWSYVEIGDEATDDEGRVFEAQWLGKTPE